MRRLLPAIAILLSACASPRPVLYPNYKLETVGQQVAEVEIEECLALAEDAAANGSGAGEIAVDTAERAGAGAAGGAAGGAVVGRAGTGAAIGAASSAAYTFVVGGLRWLFGRRGSDRLQRNYVARCLSDRGYDVIGWR